MASIQLSWQQGLPYRLVCALPGVLGLGLAVFDMQESRAALGWLPVLACVLFALLGFLCPLKPSPDGRQFLFAESRRLQLCSVATQRVLLLLATLAFVLPAALRLLDRLGA